MVSTSTFDSPGRSTVAVVTGTEEVTKSAVSWAAVFAGAVAAAATTLILLLLGTGIGLSVISPWYGAGASAITVGVSAIIWLVVVQWLSSALGGFIAGRLRTKWVGLHTHEVSFRDTAHGFLAWCLASVIGAAMLASITASGVSGLASGAATVAGGAASGAAQAGVQSGSASGALDPSVYFVDTMFRSTNPADATRADFRTETVRILGHSTQDGKVVLSPEDRTYLAQLVAARAGISQPEAEQRVDSLVKQVNDAQTKIREAADAARKRAAQLSIMLALSMVVGAFVASVAAAYGGSIRDEY
jgi:hypothetical protein